MAGEAKNGFTRRTFERDGLLVSEVEFQIGDPGEYPPGIGYMVGPDDGSSVLYPRADQAVRAFREKTDG